MKERPLAEADAPVITGIDKKKPRHGGAPGLGDLR
jgi:hypothetical protein